MEKDQVWGDYYENSNRYVTFVAGYAINKKECDRNTTRKIAKAFGQETFTEYHYGIRPKQLLLEVF